MLVPVLATIHVSFLGFTLAALYYIHFSRKLPTRGVVDSAFRSKIATALAIPGLIILMAIAPGIALDGIERIVTFLNSAGFSQSQVHFLAGIWLELAIVGGWMIEYSLQRPFRDLPRLSFSM